MAVDWSGVNGSNAAERDGSDGEGVVLNYEGSGAHARVQVNFETAGTKWLVMSYAKLELM